MSDERMTVKQSLRAQLEQKSAVIAALSEDNASLRKQNEHLSTQISVQERAYMDLSSRMENLSAEVTALRANKLRETVGNGIAPTT